MKLCLTVWENRISQVFDSARMVLIADVQNGELRKKSYELFRSELPQCRAATLSTLHVKVLICGAISQVCANMIDAYSIRIISFVTGEVDKVLDAYLKGILLAPNFQMPGCRHKGMRLKGRHGRRHSRQSCNKERS